MKVGRDDDDDDMNGFTKNLFKYFTDWIIYHPTKMKWHIQTIRHICVAGGRDEKTCKLNIFVSQRGFICSHSDDVWATTKKNI